MKSTEMIRAVAFDKHFPAESWETANRNFFDQLAKKYDHLNEIISLGQQGSYKREAVRDLKLKPGMRVLDICTGTGDMAIFMVQQTPDIKVDAVDASQAMLDLAQEKIEKLKLTNIHFQNADALKLPFEDNQFDAIMMSFGLRNFTDISSGLKEAFRVLKPGGRFISLDLGKPRGWHKILYHLYYENLMPWLGKNLFHRGEYNSFAYLSISNKHFPEPDALIQLMSEAGYKNIVGKEYMFGGLAQQIGHKSQIR